jgi:hypothetical protein
MSFFEPPPWRPESQYQAPGWVLPPEHVLPGVVPVELLMLRTNDRAVLFTDLLAYPTGFAFTLSVRLRHDIPQPHPGVGDVEEPDEFGDHYPRFGVEFADGRTATNHSNRPPDFEDQEPDPPTLTMTHGEGGGRGWNSHQWVWGLPPPGPLVFVCDWPARQLEASREVDARLVLDAAARAVALWPEVER